MNKLVSTATAQTSIVKQSTLGGEITAVKRIFPSGMKLLFAIEFPHVAKKADLKPCIDELRKLGISQKAIAFLTNISASYISQLCHRP